MPKILLAEDDIDMRRFLVKALQNAGFDVMSYDNGLSAYQRLREEPFELLLTDIAIRKWTLGDSLGVAHGIGYGDGTTCEMPRLRRGSGSPGSSRNQGYFRGKPSPCQSLARWAPASSETIRSMGATMTAAGRSARLSAI